MPNQRPEISYLVQNILPRMTEDFDFPAPENEESVKIDEIPVRIASNIKKPDTVYYWNGVPVFVIEAKKEGKSKEDAIDQALSYIRNFPAVKYSKDGIKPRFFAVTIGREIFWFEHHFEIEKNNLKDWADSLLDPIQFPDLIVKYGLVAEAEKEILTADNFRRELLNELTAIYKLGDRIEPEVVKNVSNQVLAFLEYGQNFTSHEPYLGLEKHKDRQAQIRHLYTRFNWLESIGPNAARAFRSYILRAFQGGGFNQYLTEQCVIAFMVDLVGGFGSETKVLDFECGSGGFLAAAVERGVVLENICGIDIEELPYIVAKTYLALYFKKTGEWIDALPVKKENGLFDQGSNWELIIGNPAGGSMYEHGGLAKIGSHLDRDLDRNGRLDDNMSEYNLSIQQAVTSAKIGGKICLILPEGFFSNSHDEILRKFIAKHCKVLAIMSLPRGVFKKGTSTRHQRGGAQSATMKMSIFYAEKSRDIDTDDPIGNYDFSALDYPVFLATVNEPESTSGAVCDWLEPQLEVILSQWHEWSTKGELKEIPRVELPSAKQKQESRQLPPSKEKKIMKAKSSKPTAHKSKTKISDYLKDIFQ